MQLGTVERDERSGPFFDAAASGQLLVRRCSACGHLFAPELVGCTACRHLDSDWAAVEGSATVVSWVVTHRRGDDGPIRTVVAVAELTEGPWLTLPADVDPDRGLGAGEAVRVAFIASEAGETVPVWRVDAP